MLSNLLPKSSGRGTLLSPASSLTASLASLLWRLNLVPVMLLLLLFPNLSLFAREAWGRVLHLIDSYAWLRQHLRLYVYLLQRQHARDSGCRLCLLL